MNAPRVIGEVFDDEVVIVDFQGGNYYSLAGSGLDVWRLIERGKASEAIVQSIDAAYEGDTGAIREAVESLLDELEREELIVTVTDGEAEPAVDGDHPLSPATFETPVFKRYTDMRDLLLLDPIHEVDQAGWPETKPA